MHTENLLQSLHRFRLLPTLLHLVAWSTSHKPDPNTAQSSTHLRLAIDNRPIALYEDKASLLDLLRQYALLSSQPILTEEAAERISQILELAEIDDGLALLLSQVDQALLESTDLLNQEAQDFYADQTSRILEFLTPSSETSCSEELLNLLLDQCAQSDASFVLSIEDPPDLHWAITRPLSSPKSRLSVRHRSKLLIAAFTTVAALVTGVVIVGRQVLASLSHLPSLPWQTVKTAPIQIPVETHPKIVSQQLTRTELQATASRTVLLDRQHSEASQQFHIEQAQILAEQRQQEAEQKQILAEQQNQHQEAQYWYRQAQHWYQEAQHYLKQSQVLREKAQEEINQLQPSLPKPNRTGSATHISHDGATLFASTFVTKLLIEWALFLLLSVLLMLSFTALWKRGFN